jgi:hypothetical protein
VTQSECIQYLIAWHKKLAPQINALYLTVHAGVGSKQMDNPLTTQKVGTHQNLFS